MKVVKWVVRGIGLLLFLFIVAGIISFFFFNVNQSQPSVNDAPWAIQTYSNDEYKIPARIYLAKTIDNVEGTPIITDYWSYDGKNYIHHKDSKEFPIDQYGTIDILRRSGQ